jgi:hypothetical protein
MIVDDEQDSYLQYVYNINASAFITPVEVVWEGQISFASFLNNYNAMNIGVTRVQLQNDLIKHQWDIKGWKDDI